MSDIWPAMLDIAMKRAGPDVSVLIETIAAHGTMPRIPVAPASKLYQLFDRGRYRGRRVSDL